MRAVWSNASIGGMRRSAVIVDDHAGFRARARALLAAAGYEVAAEPALTGTRR